MSLIFSATSLDECLKKASQELNISKEALNYKVIKEGRVFFKKRVKIEVELKNKTQNNNLNNIKENISEVNALNFKVENKSEQFKEYNVIENQVYEEQFEVLDYGVKVENGKIIVKDSKNSEDILTITPCEGVSLFVNGEEFNHIIPVTETDNIEYRFREDSASRTLDIKVDESNIYAYASIQYVPKSVYKIKDKDYCRNLTLEKEIVKNEYPINYTKNEIINVLKEKDICYGILESEIEKICNQQGCSNVLIAKGDMPEDDSEDVINILFNDSNELVDYNSTEKIDYRNRYAISNVKIGDVIAQKVPGKEGHDGRNIYGNVVKRKLKKNLFVKAASGCVFKENKVIATIEGKPSVKGNTFNVNRLYKSDKVDLESGNIDFIGDVEIIGTVNEGMEVTAGNDIFIGKNVESAIVNSGGDIIIYGNAIKSNISSGCENVKRNAYLETLKRYQNHMDHLILTANHIKLNSKEVRLDGEIIKTLMENKFKSLPELARKILSYNVSQGIQETQITTFIIKKLIGRGPLKIKDISELSEMQQIIKDEIEDIEQLIITPTSIQVDYSQGSNISASGDIIITGKGQYVSDICAVNNIEFTMPGAVCRGGTLKAGSEIKLRTVGSIAGVSTILKVPSNGRITADIAYNNTVFCFGEKKLLLEVSGKNVEAYMDKSGEIIIDKFIL